MKILKEANSVLNFKQIVKLFCDVTNEEEFNRACGEIDRSFQHDKLNWNDHELLYSLAGKIYKLL